MLTKNTDILRKEVAEHIASDALIRGTYWDAKNGKGCFIGCLTHSDDPAPAFERFGMPIAVLRIAENIFEALPDDGGRAFFAAMPDAVGRDGKDLSRVHWAFLAAELRALPTTTDAVKAVIDPVIAGMDLLAIGKDWPKDAADAAARTAAYAYRAAAYAAAYAADAARAADAADAAADAADAARAAAAAYAADAAYAAADAADADVAAADADLAARTRQASTLLALIAAA